MAETIISGEDMWLLLINFIITFIAYTFLPLLSRFVYKDVYTKKEAIKNAALISLMVYIVIKTYQFFVFGVFSINNLVVPIFYTIISYFILLSNKIEHNQRDNNTTPETNSKVTEE